MGKKQRTRTERSARAERFAQEWAAAVHVELLTAWGRRDDDSPMPTRQDAERVARERTDLLVAGLGPWAEEAPKLLDLNEKTLRRGRRRWSRNAWPRERRDEGDGSRWWYRWMNEEDC